MLGRLHLLSVNYVPEKRRPDWKQNLQRADETLKLYSTPENAIKEVAILNKFFESLPITTENYGLVHYDFEMDNVFFDESAKRYGVIDFDDSMYHWYVMDINQSIDSIKNELPTNIQEQAVCQFLNGYRASKSIDDLIFENMPIFKRYANLLGYTRCLRSVHERWDNEPEWMQGLRKHINNIMAEESKCFGETI